jgi:bla regulator protein blaR1
MSPFTLPAQQVLALAGDHLWQSTLLAALAALTATVLQRQSASIRYWIWFAASIKFLVPFAALVTLGGYASWRSVEVLPYRDAPLLVEAVGQPFAADAFSVRTPQRGAVARSVHNIPASLLWVWAIGVTAVLLRSLGHWYRIRQLARGATPLDDGREVQILRVLGGGKQPLPIVSTNSSLEPGVFGIVRPVLLWPRAISERLSDEQLQSVLAHEICHLRRGDNLAALVHLVVQAVFWFHPLVWWIGGRLIAERERACDEQVIRLGSEPETYAESILKTCQFFIESPLACVSGVTGSDLKKRIEEIMTNDAVATFGVWKKALLTAAGVIAFVGPVAVGALSPPPQASELPAPASLPAFEAVSIRPNPATGPGGRGGGQMQPVRYVATDLTLKNILRRAYGRDGSAPGAGLDLFESQVAGGPEWVTQEKFDIVATTPTQTQAREMRLMIQRMLAERFKLVAHWEKRELPVYILSKARADGALGPGLTLKSEADCNAVRRDGPAPAPQPGVAAPPPPCGAIQFGPGQLVATGAPMEWLANTLTSLPVVTGIDRMVLDRTGMTGNYGFTLKFAAAGATSPDPDRPELITALQEQLGLKLEATRAPIDVLVIDSVEKPTPN